MNRFGENQIRAQAESLGHPRLSFDYSDRKRSLIRPRVARALEQESGVLLVVAIHHERVEVLDHQFFHRGKRLVARLDSEVKFR